MHLFSKGLRFSVIFAAVIGAGCNKGPESWEVRYSYHDFDVPSTAIAVTPAGKVVAHAERVGFLQAEDGRRAGVEIEETYLDREGSVKYKGRLFIRWSRYAGEPGAIERTVAINGRKPWSAFVDWPDGT